MQWVRLSDGSVHLSVVSDDKYDPILQQIRSLAVSAQPVASFQAGVDWLSAMAMEALNQGERVGILDFIGHGDPGKLYFGADGDPAAALSIDVATMDTFFRLKDVVQSSTQVRLVGCDFCNDLSFWERDTIATDGWLVAQGAMRALGCRIVAFQEGIGADPFYAGGYREVPAPDAAFVKVEVDASSNRDRRQPVSRPYAKPQPADRTVEAVLRALRENKATRKVGTALLGPAFARMSSEWMQRRAAAGAQDDGTDTFLTIWSGWRPWLEQTLDIALEAPEHWRPAGNLLSVPYLWADMTEPGIRFSLRQQGRTLCLHSPIGVFSLSISDVAGIPQLLPFGTGELAL